MLPQKLRLGNVISCFFCYQLNWRTQTTKILGKSCFMFSFDRRLNHFMGLASLGELSYILGISDVKNWVPSFLLYSIHIYPSTIVKSFKKIYLHIQGRTQSPGCANIFSYTIAFKLSHLSTQDWPLPLPPVQKSCVRPCVKELLYFY